MTLTTAQIWMILAALGIGTFAIRLSFLGIIGDKQMPEWVLRHLRYAPVAILPGLVAPLVIWPSATDGTFDPARFLSAAVCVYAAYKSKNLFVGLFAGAATLWIALQFV